MSRDRKGSRLFPLSDDIPREPTCSPLPSPRRMAVHQPSRVTPHARPRFQDRPHLRDVLAVVDVGFRWLSCRANSSR